MISLRTSSFVGTGNVNSIRRLYAIMSEIYRWRTFTFLISLFPFFFLASNGLHIESFSGTLLFLYNIPLLHFLIIFFNNRTDLSWGVLYYRRIFFGGSLDLVFYSTIQWRNKFNGLEDLITLIIFLFSFCPIPSYFITTELLRRPGGLSGIQEKPEEQK